MVVAYKLGAITAFALRTLRLVKIKHFSQPNLLAGKELVPEFFQEAASAENLANALAHWLEHPADVAQVQQEFEAIHVRLRCDGADRAAAEVAALLATRAVPA
jgi:lipid-A-disaccharide synthase